MTVGKERYLGSVSNKSLMEWIKDLNTWNTEENLKLSGGGKEGGNKYICMYNW